MENKKEEKLQKDMIERKRKVQEKYLKNKLHSRKVLAELKKPTCDITAIKNLKEPFAKDELSDIEPGFWTVSNYIEEKLK